MVFNSMAAVDALLTNVLNMDYAVSEMRTPEVEKENQPQV